MADCSELSKLLLDMTTVIAEMPHVHNIDNVVDEMKKTIPAMNRTVLVDAIVEATATKKKKVDELKKKLGEIKREAKVDQNTRTLIDELLTYLETGTFPNTVKEPSTTPEAIKKLRIIVTNLKAKLSKTEAGKKYRQKQQEPKMINNLEQEIAALEKHISEGTLPVKIGTEKIEPSDAVRILREKREKLKKMLAQSEPFRVRQLREQIELLEERMRTGDIFPKPKIETDVSREVEVLEHKKRRLQRDIRARIKMAEPRGWWGNTKEVFNAFRALMTGGEFSLVLRQGGWSAMSRPGVVAKAIPAMFRSFASEEVSHNINEEILSRPNAHLYTKGKLHLAPIDGSATLGAMEELYMSHWIEKIPGLQNFQRAGLTFLNSIRADMFDILVRTLPVTASGAHNQIELEAIANYINVSTGRGNLGKAEQAAETLNTVFFAPKYVVSRFQLLLGQPAWKGTATTRKLVAEEYVRAILGMTVVYAIASLAGGDDEWDPRSSDFGKVKFGNTRLDPMFGLSQTTVILSRLISGTTKNSAGKIIPISKFRGKVPYGANNSWDTFGRFMRSKLSPLAGTTADLAAGENLVGEEIDLKTYPLRLITPLAYKDIYDAMLEQSIPETLAFSLLVFFGMGLQTYQSKGKSGFIQNIETNNPRLLAEIERLEKVENLPTVIDFEQGSLTVKELKTQISDPLYQQAILWANEEYGRQATREMFKADYRRASDEGKKEILNKIRGQVRTKMLEKFHYRKPKKRR